MNTKQMREERAKLFETIKGISAKAETESRALSAEEQTNWDKANADFDALTKRIEVAERAAKISGELSATGGSHPGAEDRNGNSRPGEPTDEQRTIAMNGWFREQRGIQPNAEQRKAMDACGYHTNSREVSFSMPSGFAERSVAAIDRRIESRAAQSAIIGSLGGYLVPSTFLNTLERAMLFYGPMLQTSQVIRTATGEPMSWPGVNDTGNTGRQIGESTAVTTTTVSFALQTWNAYKYTTDEVLIPYELLRDSSFNLVPVIAELLGERLGRILNTKFTTGTGASTPFGITARSVLGVTAASATAVTADEMIDLVYSVDRAYRPQGSWMMNDGIMKAIRKLKDGQGQYLFTPSNNSGEPDRFFSYPIAINNDMQATLATGTKTVLFGQLDKYKVRQVGEYRFYRLVERHRESDQDAFIGYSSADGDLLNSGGNPVKHLIQA